MTNSRTNPHNKTSSKQSDDPALLDNWRRLNLSIKGQPNQFQQHSQRILFALQNNLHQFLPGALQDLFIATGHHGRQLRERMYSLVVPLIDHNDREYFHEWLAHNTDATLEGYRFPGSVLISQTCLPSPPDTDPYVAINTGTLIDQGRHAIAHGRVEMAESMLLAACDKKRPDTSHVEEIMSLYAATRQKEKLTALANNLQRRRFKLSKYWKQVLESSKQW
ncbi:MAG: hypothetical protein ACPG47_03115 [Leucothrix sp.]